MALPVARNRHVARKAARKRYHTAALGSVRPRRKQLMIGTKDERKAHAILSNSGYAIHSTSNNGFALPDDHAVKHPDYIARLLAHHEVPLTMVNIEEENLEHYFLNVIGAQEEKPD